MAEVHSVGGTRRKSNKSSPPPGGEGKFPATFRNAFLYIGWRRRASPQHWRSGERMAPMNQQKEHPITEPMKLETNTQHSPRFSWAAYVLLGALMIYQTGCRTVSEGSSEMKQQALAFAPPPGKANIYMIRPGRLAGRSLKYSVTLDLAAFGTLENDSYLFAPVSPGKHGLQGSFLRRGLILGEATRTGALLNFNAEAGQNYYFKIEPPIWPGIGPGIEQIAEPEGRDRVQKSRLSAVNRFEYQK